MASIDVVVGGQYGSEAKGTVAARLLDRRNDAGTRISVRVGGPNAGHTVVDHAGNTLRLRQVPVGVIFPDCLLGIAEGSEVDLEVLEAEIATCEAAGHRVRERLYVDPHATVLEGIHRRAEVQEGLIERLGSTAKGIGMARSARVLREAKLVRDLDGLDFHVMQVAPLIRASAYACLEGTQGYGLGLHTDFYPFCTSGDCRAIDVMAQSGISPWDHKVSWVEPWLVFRPYPIRVAGNSGPLLGETSWEALGLPQEWTTVTNKVRRVGMWDPQLAYEAINANGKDVSVAITMADQCDGYMLDDIIKQITVMGGKVRMVGHGPELAAYTWYAQGRA